MTETSRDDVPGSSPPASGLSLCLGCDEKWGSQFSNESASTKLDVNVRLCQKSDDRDWWSIRSLWEADTGMNGEHTAHSLLVW